MELCYIRAMMLLNKELLTRLLMESAGAITPVALWTDDVQRSQWRSREDVLMVYPRAKFLGSSMVTFSFDAGGCSVTAQIAYNTAIVIVLAASANSNLGKERH